MGIDAAGLLVTVTSAIIFCYRCRGSGHWPMIHGTVEYGMTSDTDGWKTNLDSYAVDGEFDCGVHPPGTKPKPTIRLARGKARVSRSATRHGILLSQ